ncbi:NADAR family protein [Nocardia vermiculata]|uniref:NADAR family protein n=1 Tax=Nocardia vermiculata TaxID=257274 RepID=A0A846Y9G3_9NOCA|nr:NADAR family protein [Nocardia vermiculata]NKY53389.1 NADAR family protein [Nocardia vermiculata]
MQPRTVTELIDLLDAGARVQYLPFWGHQPRSDGFVGAECLSQWWPAEFTLDDVSFRTAEHYMMWKKAMLFEDSAAAERIVAAETPGEAKSLGRIVCGFDEKVWDERRYAIVVAANTAKFGQHERLRDFLVNTGERVLVEASPVDRIWGIGMTVDDPRAESPREWEGLNLLGFALMTARDRLRTAARAAGRDLPGDR